MNPDPASNHPVPLESILRTEELQRRPSRPPDYQTENRALTALAKALADSPDTILQTLADTILDVFQVHSAGLSLLTTHDGGRRFPRPAITGAWKPHLGGGTPRDFGPSGDVLDRNVPLLFTYFERRYPYLRAATPAAEEALLIPFFVNGKAVGTIWAMAHDDRRRFDAEDLRQLESLGRFASAAYQTVHLRQTDDSRRAALNLMEDAVQAREAAEHANAKLREREAEVRRNAETFSKLVEGSPFGIYTVDSRFRIVRVSAGAQPVFANVRPLIGRDFGEAIRIIWPEPFAGEVTDIFRRTLESGEPYLAPSLTGQRHDVKVVESYEWQVHRMTLPDGQYGVVCYFFDATRLRQAEAALAETDRRKNEFLAMLAHELRNPLAPIRNAIEILKRSAASEPATPVTELMERQVAQLVRLIDDLLDVSRVSHGKIELRRATVDLASLIHHAVEAARPLFDAADVNLTVTPPSEPILLHADSARIVQVLGNLLNNAAKFTPSGGDVSLSAARNGDDAVIRVRDSGIGIAAENLSRVFDMFAQVDTSLERTRGGLGLGLTLARNLVELHGGTVAAHSGGHGQGTEFVVRVPVSAEAQETAHAQRAPDNDQVAVALRRILVVDDNRDSAESLATLLALRGHDVRTAHDGLEAIDAASTFKPDVILLDIGMPGLNGYEAARRIRALPSGENIVLVALTGWGQDSHRTRSLDAGFDVHLVKPVGPEALSRLIADAPKN